MPSAFLEITNQEPWEAFIREQPWASFPQSWTWGEFQRSQGQEVRRFFWQEDGKTLIACQFIQYRRRFGVRYWVAVRGPVFLESALPRARELFHAFLRALSQQDLPGLNLFFRLEPLIRAEQGKGIMVPRFVRTHARSPAATRRILLREPEDALLSQMHHKTRYNIRISEKHGVTVRLGKGPEDLAAFLRLTRETSERDGFVSHHEAYLKATYEKLAPTGMVRLRIAEYNGEALAINMEVVYGDTVTYLHGASASHERQVMCPYALQWQAMRTAKEEGHTYYDLWGCNPALTSNFYYKKSWEGISRFKQGWGGELVQLIGTWDLPIYRIPYLFAFPKALWRS